MISVTLSRHGTTRRTTGIPSSVFYTFRDSLSLSCTGGIYTYTGKGDSGRASRIDGQSGRCVFCLLTCKLGHDLSFQHIVKSYRDLSPDGFWNRFTANGKRMTYTAITKHLRAERTAADRSLADQARKRYGDDFASKFNYRCGNQILVMKTDQKIAERYRMLHPSCI
jgi:hypothetical protein